MTQDNPDPMQNGTDHRPTKEAADTVASEGQEAGSPWDTDSVVSWISPNLKRGKK